MDLKHNMWCKEDIVKGGRRVHFSEIKELFACGVWSKNMVRTAMRKGKISKEEFLVIVGERN